MPSSSRTRVLCLHGYAQNAGMLEGKLTRAKQTFGEDVELPNILLRPTLSAQPPSSADSCPPADDEPRCWWRWSSNEGFADPSELDRTLTYLRGVLEAQGPFDGVLGFSMGSAAASLLCAILERPALHPVFAAPASSADAVWPHPPFRFAILASGYVPGERRCWDWLSPPLSTPALHAIGKGDVVVDNGHHIPRKASFFTLCHDFIIKHSQHSTPASPTPSPSLRPRTLSTSQQPSFPFLVLPGKTSQPRDAAAVADETARKMRELTRTLWAEVKEEASVTELCV
ncbi:hypothetical protein JCM10213v2_001121 [Rhodosporidiobolus nylandii]